MTEGDKKYYDNAFKHLAKQNHAILTALAIIMTPEQYRKYSDVLRKQNSRQAEDIEKIQKMFKH